VKILFLHGMEARPGGFKPQFLIQHGFDVLNPHLPDESWGDSVSIAQNAFDLNRPPVVVGSSRGAAVAMAIDSADARLVLIAPAWRLCGIDPVVKPATTILHSPDDELISLDDSRHLVEINQLSHNALREVGESHRMNDDEALAALLLAVQGNLRIAEGT